MHSPTFVHALTHTHAYVYAYAQTTAPIGNALLELNDACVAAETCEELFTPDSPHIQQALNGAEIFLNGSGSHHNLRKLQVQIFIFFWPL